MPYIEPPLGRVDRHRAAAAAQPVWLLRPGRGGRRQRPDLAGLGVIVEGHGLVITNEHVVAGAARIRVQLADGRELPATLIGADRSFDLAVLKVETQNHELPALRLGTAADLMIGETVIAIGNPFGLSHTVTSGVISALHRVVRAKNRTYEDFIQTDAQINPGNSGGPLLNIHGELIGINTAVHSGGPGIGFAIPIDRARTIVNDLLQFGRVRYGWLGIRPSALRQGRRAVGVVVAEVEAGSPAERAGIQRGEVIVGVNDDNTPSVEAFWDRIQRVPAGKKSGCACSAARCGHRLRRSIPKSSRAAPSDDLAWMSPTPRGGPSWCGESSPAASRIASASRWATPSCRSARAPSRTAATSPLPSVKFARQRHRHAGGARPVQLLRHRAALVRLAASQRACFRASPQPQAIEQAAA